VAEVMLQQTRVATVLPYYRRFLERFPDPPSLARADEEQVLALWSGLGYYRRARALRAGAREVTERYGGSLPADPAELRRLPGVGRYTAGAIASIAFGLREPVLDGNVRRVLARVLALDTETPGRSEAERRLWTAAGELVDGPDPGGLNQALMELGAVLCTPREPSCEACPVARYCRARIQGRPEAYPARRASAAPERREIAVAVIRRAGRVLLERPPEGGPLRGTWDLPAREIHLPVPAEESLAEALTADHGLEVVVGPAEGRLGHSIMQSRLLLEIRLCRLRRGRVAGREGLRWIDPQRLDDAAVSGATRKVLRRLRRD
jgi:A/G-specific adenine glycosylase